AEIVAAAPGASWDKPGAEAAVATLTLDGQYNQDVFILRGGELSAYRVFLGPLTPGRHTLEIVRSDRWSAPGAGFRVQQVRASVIDLSSPDFRAVAHAPILYARADTLGRFSDAPLLMWYERFSEADGETIQYSIVFTNEDGGTPTDALMARWGRPRRALPGTRPRRPALRRAQAGQPPILSRRLAQQHLHGCWLLAGAVPPAPHCR